MMQQPGSHDAWQAIYHGVPIVGMPLSNDQPYNIARAAHLGFGLAVDTKNISGLVANLQHAIAQILQDDTFRMTAQRLSAIVRSRRLSPAEAAASEARPCKPLLLPSMLFLCTSYHLTHCIHMLTLLICNWTWCHHLACKLL